MIKHGKFVAAAVAAVIAASAYAAVPGQARGITVGASVKDAGGGEVGTVTAVNGQTATVRTDRHEVQLPVGSFTPHQGVLLIGMSRDQLNAEVEKAMAAARATLAPGVAVRGSAGIIVGTLEAIDDQFATLKLTSGKVVRVPRAGIAPGQGGAVVGISAADLNAAAQAQTGSASSS